MYKQAKYWIDTKGTIHLVCLVNEGPQLCHEEWAEKHNSSLEKLLKKGWIRIQHIIPQYIFIDFEKINKNQTESIYPLLNCDKIIVNHKGNYIEGKINS